MDLKKIISTLVKVEKCLEKNNLSETKLYFDFVEVNTFLTNSLSIQEQQKQIPFGAYQPKQGDRWRNPKTGKIQPFSERVLADEPEPNGDADKLVKKFHRSFECEIPKYEPPKQPAPIDSLFKNIVVDANAFFKEEHDKISNDGDLLHKLAMIQTHLTNIATKTANFEQGHIKSTGIIETQVHLLLIRLADFYNEMVKLDEKNIQKTSDN